MASRDEWGRLRRTVRRSAAFVAKAERLFPPGGATDGRASFDLFERLVLKAVELQFSLDFDELPVAVAGVPAIRHVMTHAVPLFPALVIYGVHLDDESVEILDIDVDEGYWSLIADDPAP